MAKKKTPMTTTEQQRQNQQKQIDKYKENLARWNRDINGAEGEFVRIILEMVSLEKLEFVEPEETLNVRVLMAHRQYLNDAGKQFLKY
jgi:16S rRNA G527 N7-methylase RsmG